MRLRLSLLLVVPAVALIVLGWLVVVNRQDVYKGARDASLVALLANDVAELDGALSNEALLISDFVFRQENDIAAFQRLGGAQRQVDDRIEILRQSLASGSLSFPALEVAVDAVAETLTYRVDVIEGRITALQIADRYSVIRRCLLTALNRSASSGTDTGQASELIELVSLIEARSAHLDERLGLNLALEYGSWAPGQHSSVVQAIASGDELLRHTAFDLQQGLDVPAELAAAREAHMLSFDVPELSLEEWAAISNDWLATLDTTVSSEVDRILLAFVADEEQAFASRRTTIIAIALVLLFAIVVTVLVSYRLVRRVRLITQQAQSLAHGEFPEPTLPMVRGSDEVGQLAAAFDDMNDRLARAATFQRLESEVLENVAQGQPLEDSLRRTALLLGIDADGEPRFAFTTVDPGNGALPIHESRSAPKPLWVVPLVAGASVPTGSEARSAFGLAALVQARADANKQLEYQAHHDHLTGLLNRRAILEKSDTAAAAGSVDTQVGLLFLDLDGFKQVNDTHGHRAGDEVLVMQSQRLLNLARTRACWVGRLGGDEFLVVIPDVADERELEAIASQYASALAPPLTFRDLSIVCGASVGAVLARPGVAAEDLRHEADTALYSAKSEGRGVAVTSSPELRAKLKQRDELCEAFRVALTEGEIVPFYQPIWSDKGNRLCGLEALARWRRPSHGVVSPGEFLPVAEDLGVLTDVDTTIFRLACEQIVVWRAAGLEVPPVHINASSSSINHPDLVPRTQAILASTGCPPSSVVLEVTESGLVTDLDSREQALQQLRAHGLAIAADDFGTGYSSFAYLQSLPIDIVKVDRQFINRIDESVTSQAIVAVLSDLAGLLGVELIAEGIERIEELDYLVSIGCTKLQGFLLGRPASAAVTRSLIGAHSNSGTQP